VPPVEESGTKEWRWLATRDNGIALLIAVSRRVESRHSFEVGPGRVAMISWSVAGKEREG
jgi:hypothetical protein